MTLKDIKELHTPRGRREQGRCIVEGYRAILTFIEAGLTPIKMYCTEQARERYEKCAGEIISERKLAQISTSTQPSGLLAIFPIPEPIDRPLGPGLVCAQIQDPGNLGTLIRTAAALGVHSCVTIEGADPWGPKVIQASAGTIARVRPLQLSWQELIANSKAVRKDPSIHGAQGRAVFSLRSEHSQLSHKASAGTAGRTVLGNQHPLSLCALVPDGGTPLTELPLEELLFVVGNEAHGLPEEWIADCAYRATLPMPGGTESLNAAVAGSLALYYSYLKNKISQ